MFESVSILLFYVMIFLTHRKIVVALISITIVVSCDQIRTAEILPDPINLEGVRILESHIGIRDLEQVDSLLIMSNYQEPLFRFFSKTGSFLGGFGRIGNGPGEFSMPMTNAFADIIHTRDGIYFMIHNTLVNTMIMIDIGASLSSGETVIYQEYALPRDLLGAWGPNVYQIHDSLLIGMYEDRFTKRLDEKRGYFYFHANDSQFELLPLLNLSLDQNELYPSININARGAHITPDRSKVVMPYVYMPMIDILDVKTKTITTLQLNEIPMETTFSLDDFNKDQLIEYYDAIYTTDEWIYVSYIGKIPSDDQDMVIRVMDWSGKVHNQYRIGQEYAIGGFVVCEANMTIYGISDELDAIFEFKYLK